MGIREWPVHCAKCDEIVAFRFEAFFPVQVYCRECRPAAENEKLKPEQTLTEYRRLQQQI